MRAARALEKLHADNEDQAVGVRIVARALEEPLRQIADNAGDHADIVVARVKERSGNFGYDAARGEYDDLVDRGILDPKKVARLALQNAASVSGLLLTTEVTAVEAAKNTSAKPSQVSDMDEEL